MRVRRALAAGAIVLVAVGFGPVRPVEATPEVNQGGVAVLGLGSIHTCARMTTGHVRCWGNNDQGSLGDGTSTDRLLPVAVTNATGSGPLVGVSQVGGGLGHTCALLTSDQARCWGTNIAGQLGDGTMMSKTRPVPVSNPTGTGSLTGIAQLTTGDNHTCARLNNGQARCWGANLRGQLGDGTTTPRTRPVTVANATGTGPLTGITQLSAGDAQTCALLASGQARCWGSSTSGQVGDGDQTDRHFPVVVRNATDTAPLRDIAELSAGNSYTCARLENGQARCWGFNGTGQLGDDSTVLRTLPVTVVDPAGAGPLVGVNRIAAGFAHTCVRLAGGQARCWGRNDFGQLGDGTTVNRLRPVTVSNPAGNGALPAVTAVETGGVHTCALLTSGQVRCWGRNQFGELGDGTTTNHALPGAVVQPLTCVGQPATVDLTQAQSPTAGYDVIFGTSGGDNINALGGGDLVCGQGGNDTVNGGAGNDRVLGGAGNDTLDGGAGNDALEGGPGNDTCRGRAGTDTGPGCETRTGIP